MTFGASLNFQNANGDVQIDQNYACLEVFAEGEITSAGGGYSDLHVLSYSGILRPLIFVKLAVNKRYFFGPTTATTFWMSTNMSSGEKIPYKICGLRSDLTAPAGGWGMAISRPGTQEIVFASSRKYLRVVDTLQVVDRVTLAPLREGDWHDYSTGGEGLMHWQQINHPTKPIPLDTYWLATMTGLRPRPGSDNTSIWALERKSTTRYELEGREYITAAARESMGLPETVNTNSFANILITY